MKNIRRKIILKWLIYTKYVVIMILVPKITVFFEKFDRINHSNIGVDTKNKIK